MSRIGMKYEPTDRNETYEQQKIEYQSNKAANLKGEDHDCVNGCLQDVINKL